MCWTTKSNCVLSAVVVSSDFQLIVSRDSSGSVLTYNWNATRATWGAEMHQHEPK